MVRRLAATEPREIDSILRLGNIPRTNLRATLIFGIFNMLTGVSRCSYAFGNVLTLFGK